MYLKIFQMHSSRNFLNKHPLLGILSQQICVSTYKQFNEKQELSKNTSTHTSFAKFASETMQTLEEANRLHLNQ